METEKKEIKLPRDVFETLHASALAYGGIGGKNFVDADGPMCVAGHLGSFTKGPDQWPKEESTVLELTWFRVGLRPSVNDPAVAAINARKGNAPEARVSFEEYIAELNIVPDDTDVEYGALFNA